MNKKNLLGEAVDLEDIVCEMGNDILLRAAKFAKKKHEGQLDDCGESYFKAHLCQVAFLVFTVSPDDWNLQAAAYLHDTIEDTKTTYKELVEEFNQDVADLVLEVTHSGQKDNYGYYFPCLHSERGIVLKFADRLSNLSRMGAWPKGRRQQYLRKSKFWNDGSDRGTVESPRKGQSKKSP